MADLRKRFGELLAAHRRRRGLTQEDLAEAAGLSVDMISKIEVGATGARFRSIERLAQAVQVDPAELFTSNLPSGSMSRGAFGEISAKLSSLPESDLVMDRRTSGCGAGARARALGKIKTSSRTNCDQADQASGRN